MPTVNIGEKERPLIWGNTGKPEIWPFGISTGTKTSGGKQGTREKMIETLGTNVTPQLYDVLKARANRREALKKGQPGGVEYRNKSLKFMARNFVAYPIAEQVVSRAALMAVPQLAATPFFGFLPVIGTTVAASRLYNISRKRRQQLRDADTLQSRTALAGYNILFGPADAGVWAANTALGAIGNLWQGQGPIAERVVKTTKLDENLSGFESVDHGAINKIINAGERFSKALDFGATKAVDKGQKPDVKKDEKKAA